MAFKRIKIINRNASKYFVSFNLIKSLLFTTKGNNTASTPSVMFGIALTKSIIGKVNTSKQNR
ncbi:hypothetical protein [Xanthomarina spongicola]|uniref:hypothetical protein n=1 Tax=Xanthomarina spongicola TaxID=570520 RepID=UPI00147555C2|nr:hypothetical protein [Xanthomarina spongicola]